MFFEFTRCSWRGFVIALVAGVGVVLLGAIAASVTGNAMALQFSLILGLFVARLAETALSHSCQWSKASLEGAVLALCGVFLLVADELIQLV